MALTSEDKKDVKKHLGKALANKVSKVTRDSNHKAEKSVKNPKSKALAKKSGFDHVQHAKHNKNIDDIDKKFGIGRHDPRDYSQK